MKNSINKNVPRLRFPEFENEPAWEEKKLGETATFLKGKGISKSDITTNGMQPCIRYGELYTTYNEIIKNINSYTNVLAKNLVLSKANDVIIPASGETQKDIATASCIINSNIALGGDLNVIRSKMNGVFLAYYLNNAKKNAIAQLSQGISVVHLYSSQLKKLNINIPSLSEQQKIADCLTALDDLITAQNQKVDSLRQHKKGLMQQLFPQAGENRPKLRFLEFENAPAWEEKKLGDVGEIITGKTPSTKKLELWGGNIDFITPTDICSKYQEDTSRKVVKTEKMKILPIGSIAYTCIASIGKMTITTKASITNQQINSIISNESNNNEFIYYLLLAITPYIKSTQANTTFSIINKFDFSKFKINLPEPKEQQKIADCLTSLDDLITAQSQKIATLQQHKKGLMQQLFPNNETSL